MKSIGLERWMTGLSNWGCWGLDDQLGALNLITAEERRLAAGLVRAGTSVSQARDADPVQAPDNDPPFRHIMLSTEPHSIFATDSCTFTCHTYGPTHLDALCHVFYRDRMYNGFRKETVTRKGAAKLSVINLKAGVFARGVLVDVTQLKGRRYLQPGQAIPSQDLAAWEKLAGLRVGRGDVVLIRTGRWAYRARHGSWDIGKSSAGIEASCARWLHERDIAMLERFRGRCASIWGGRGRHADPSALDRGHGRANSGQLLPGTVEQGCRQAEALGISANRGAAGRARRDGLPLNSDCVLLTRLNRRKER